MTWYLKKNTSLTSSHRLYSCPNPLIGLTGGIASGKSTAAHFFSKRGFKIIDADKLIKNIYQRRDVLDKIQESFPFVFDETNQINFNKFRSYLFNNPSSLKKVEDILYPFLPEEFQKNLSGLSPGEVIIYEVPLLFEKKLETKMDDTLLAYIPRPLQKERLMQRNSLTSLEAEKILNQQMDIELKKSLTMNIIHNIHDLTYLNKEIDNIIAKMFTN